MKQLRSTSGIPSEDLTRGAGSLSQATQTYSLLRKTHMHTLLLVVKAKRTQSQKTPVPVQDTHIEVPANTWANMCDYLKGLR